MESMLSRINSTIFDKESILRLPGVLKSYKLGLTTRTNRKRGSEGDNPQIESAGWKQSLSLLNAGFSLYLFQELYFIQDLGGLLFDLAAAPGMLFPNLLLPRL
jgi:hypothetical protein